MKVAVMLSLFVALLPLTTTKSYPALSSSVWDLKNDIKNTILYQSKNRERFDFEATGLYEKYISQRTIEFPDGARGRPASYNQSPDEPLRYSQSSLAMT